MSLSPSYALGLLFIVLVAIIWAASSVLTQFLYKGHYQFDSPFLLTYIGVSLFTLWLPAKCFQTILLKRCLSPSSSETSSSFPSRTLLEYRDDPTADIGNSNDTSTDESSSSHNDTSPRTQPYQDDPEVQNYYQDNNRDLSMRRRNYHDHDDDDNELQRADSLTHRRHTTSHSRSWSNQDHVRAAIKIAPVWFAANWTYNASLIYTSITSSTVLASTGSVFTFLFAVLCRDERFGWIKFAGVIMGVCGSILTALGDVASDREGSEHPTNQQSDACWEHRDSFLCRYGHLLGDALGLMSAVGYGAYAVQTRVLCPHDESLYSMQILLGYIGLINMICLSPIAIYLVFVKHMELPAAVLGFLVLKGVFDNVLSDYLWLRSVILTNATVATVGLGLTIPLAFLSDVLLKTSDVISARSIFGALAVLGGFVLVNVGNETGGISSSEVASMDTEAEEMLPMDLRDSEDDEEKDGTTVSSGTEENVPMVVD